MENEIYPLKYDCFVNICNDCEFKHGKSLSSFLRVALNKFEKKLRTFDERIEPYVRLDNFSEECREIYDFVVNYMSIKPVESYEIIPSHSLNSGFMIFANPLGALSEVAPHLYVNRTDKNKKKISMLNYGAGRVLVVIPHDK